MKKTKRLNNYPWKRKKKRNNKKTIVWKYFNNHLKEDV
jgi:hypothetical protein